MGILEPELIKEILNDRDKEYPKPEAHTYIKKILGDGLALSQGEKWAKMRKLANYAFHGESLKVSSWNHSQLVLLLTYLIFDGHNKQELLVV